MDQLYREIILDNYRNPQNVGSLDSPTHSAMEENLSCGDAIKVDLDVKNGKIENIKHHTEGCAISIASASILSEKIANMKKSKVLILDENDIIDMLGAQLTTSRMKCAMLSLKAVKKALKDK